MDRDGPTPGLPLRSILAGLLHRTQVFPGISPLRASGTLRCWNSRRAACVLPAFLSARSRVPLAYGWLYRRLVLGLSESPFLHSCCPRPPSACEPFLSLQHPLQPPAGPAEDQGGLLSPCSILRPPRLSPEPPSRAFHSQRLPHSLKQFAPWLQCQQRQFQLKFCSTNCIIPLLPFKPWCFCS